MCFINECPDPPADGFLFCAKHAEQYCIRPDPVERRADGLPLPTCDECHLPKSYLFSHVVTDHRSICGICLVGRFSKAVAERDEAIRVACAASNDAEAALREAGLL